MGQLEQHRKESMMVFIKLTFCWAGKHKVSQGYSPADLPIHAKSGREWGPENAGLAYALRDDDL